MSRHVRLMRPLLTVFVLFLALVSGASATKMNLSLSGAILLLAEPRLPNAQHFKESLEARLKGRVKIDAMEAEDPSVILLRVRGGTVMVGLVDAPVPAGTLDDLCAGAWYWSKACGEVARHQAHVLVNLMRVDLDKLDTYLLLTDLMAALMDANAVASYWGASLQSPEAFLKQSARSSRAEPPVWLWTNFRLSRDKEKGYSASTQGMEAFDVREIEAKDVDRNGLEVFTLLIGMAQYLVSHGPVIKDDDTIGSSPALNIRVRQGPSYWREGRTVYRVQFPQKP